LAGKRLHSSSEENSELNSKSKNLPASQKKNDDIKIKKSKTSFCKDRSMFNESSEESDEEQPDDL